MASEKLFGVSGSPLFRVIFELVKAGEGVIQTEGIDQCLQEGKEAKS